MNAVAAPGRLRILTVNTHKGFGQFNRRFVLPQLRDAVREVSADLVFLQEVLGEHRQWAGRHPEWPSTPQYEFLADTVWPQFAYGRNAVYPAGHHGNVLLSKYPIRSHRNLNISSAGGEERGLLHALLDVGRPLHAVCVHLGLSETQRTAQLHLLCALLDSLPANEPVIVAGDFNDWRQRADAVLGRCGLREAFVQAHGVAARSFPARWPLLRLDRIYVRHLQLHDPRVLGRRPWSHLSDHLPLSVEVIL